MDFLFLNAIVSVSFTSISTFLVGTLTLVKSEGSNAKKIFAAYMYGISWWSFSQIFLITANNPVTAFAWDRAMNAVVFILGTLFFHFVISFLGIDKKRKQKILIRVAYIISFSISFFAVFGNFLQVSVSPRFFLNYYTVPGPLYDFAMLFFLFHVVYGHFLLFKAYRSSVGVRHNQLAYLFWFSLVGYIGGTANFLLVYNINIPILNPFGTYFVGFYAIAITYAIFKYQLMDIKLAVKRSLIYAVLVTLMIGLMNIISLSSDWLIRKIPGAPSWFMPFIAVVLTIFAGRLFWRKSKEADRLKYEFITVASHKLRTPLTKIKWSATQLKDIKLEGPEEEEKNRIASDILNANYKLLELTRQLVDVSETEAYGYLYQLEPVDIKEIAQNVIKEMNNQIKEKNIKIYLNFEEGLVKTKFDKSKISSVIQILLENAIDYTKDKIYMEIKKEKKNILFSIKDNGIGVSKQDQDYIFSKFFRTHSAYLKETEGVGIGLSIAKNIINKHNGKFGVESEGESKGSRFWFKIPILL
jgi:signal transduction histidine kinase